MASSKEEEKFDEIFVFGKKLNCIFYEYQIS